VSAVPSQANLTRTEALTALRQAVDRRHRVLLEGARGSAATLVAAWMHREFAGCLFIVTPDLEKADTVEDDLDCWQAGRTLRFPSWDVLPTESPHLDLETLRERVRTLRALANVSSRPAPAIVIAPIASLLQPTVPPDELSRGELRVAPGQEMAPEALCARLADARLERTVSAEAPGQFSRRGGIVDVFPLFGEAPYRLEFFGDTVESLHRYDPATQRSTEPADAAVLVDLSTEGVHRAFRGEPCASIAAHLPEETVVLVLDPDDCAHHAELYAEGYQGQQAPIRSLEQACATMHGFRRVLVPQLREDEWPPEWGEGGELARIELDTHGLARLEGTTEHALNEVRVLLDASVAVTIFCHNDAARRRCREVLLEAGGALSTRAELTLGRLTEGFHWPALDWAAISAHEIFHRYRERRRVRKPIAPSQPVHDFAELRPGDYVVHLLHGIARNLGLMRLEQNGQESDFLALLFAEDTRLYVPTSHVELVHKYIGGRGARPELSRLGGRSWRRKKAQAERAVREIAADLLRLQAVRMHAPGIAYPPDGDWERKFEEEFLYEETDDQLTALAEIKADMQGRAPMDRLLCGDVGFGKTELAVRAAFKAVVTGRQAAVLVPTTILAEQHHRTFTERMADYPVRVEVLSRFRTAADQRRIVEAAREGKVDVLIGTHRLLSRDMGFDDLGLVIIDEEQRFGVEHKERLKELRACVDVLTMTATPIPRTLHMALLGLRDISTLTTPPLDRQAIRTQVVRYRDDLIRRAVLRELARSGQVYFVHNRVYNIEQVATHVAEIVPEARVGVAHGQMPERDLAGVMRRFIDNDIDVLVATTIIESGLDIPNVNTLFVNDADQYGLADLHQLRGRVGRYRNRAYAYFLAGKRRPLTPVGAKRLRAIEEFAHLGAGYDLALRDLEIRGAGNLLGVEQSGQIHQVGYDLYCRLLERVVKELRGQPAEEREPVELDLGSSAYVPDTYINLEQERLRFYRRLGATDTAEQLDDLRAWTVDRYGPMPASVEALFADERLRQRARACGINYVGRLPRAVILGTHGPRRRAAMDRLRDYQEHGRKLAPLEAERYRLGLGYYEEEWPGFHRDLIEAALTFLEQAGIPDLEPEPVGGSP